MAFQKVFFFSFLLLYFTFIKKKKKLPSLGQFGSADRVSAWRLKSPRFKSSQGHMPRLHWSDASQCGGLQEATEQWVSLIDVSASPSAFPSEINIYICLLFFKKRLSIFKKLVCLIKSFHLIIFFGQFSSYYLSKMLSLWPLTEESGVTRQKFRIMRIGKKL